MEAPAVEADDWIGEATDCGSKMAASSRVDLAGELLRTSHSPASSAVASSGGAREGILLLSSPGGQRSSAGWLWSGVPSGPVVSSMGSLPGPEPRPSPSGEGGGGGAASPPGRTCPRKTRCDDIGVHFSASLAARSLAASRSRGSGRRTALTWSSAASRTASTSPSRCSRSGAFLSFSHPSWPLALRARSMVSLMCGMGAPLSRARAPCAPLRRLVGLRCCSMTRGAVASA